MMKLQKYHDIVTKAFKDFASNEENHKQLVRYISIVKSEGDYKNLEVRIAWDLLRVCFHRGFVTEEFYEKYGANDDHVTTLVTKCFRDANLGVLL